MNIISSNGLGVNSIAMEVILREEGIKHESVFVNHGGDYPETYEYLDYIRKQGFRIIELKTENIEGYNTLAEYCLGNKIKPLGCNRWCTDKFKVRYFWQKYANFHEPCIVYIGFDYGEKHRANRNYDKLKYAKHPASRLEYPLVERKIDRKGCKQIIENAGLKVPPKSCCYFCHNRNKKELRELKKKHPELYKIANKITLQADRAYANRHYRILPKFNGGGGCDSSPD